MEENKLDAQYWEKRYQLRQDGWDIGEVSEPIKHFFDTVGDKGASILIPGCGRAYEGIYLFQNGYKHVHLLDFASQPLQEVLLNCPEFPSEHLHQADFFKWQGSYDLIVEQTMFCAILPELREKYVAKLASLLKPNGKVIGVLFNRTFESSPPFGGSKEEYMELFGKYFSQVDMETCYNSIPPRMGSELFFQAKL